MQVYEMFWVDWWYRKLTQTHLTLLDAFPLSRIPTFLKSEIRCTMCASVQVDLALQRQVSLPFVRPHYFKLPWLKLSPILFFFLKAQLLTPASSMAMCFSVKRRMIEYGEAIFRWGEKQKRERERYREKGMRSSKKKISSYDEILMYCFQKSLVLLSQHPFVGLFSRVVSMLGPAYFDVGQPMLEAACASIASW
jgi:hypothetical protein